MKNILRLSSVFLLFVLLGGTAVNAKRNKTVRLTTYNIQHGKGQDGRIDYDRIGQLLKTAGAQVVAMQEVDSMTKRTEGHYGLAEIGRAAGLKATYAPAIDFQGGKYGIGVLSKKKPRQVRRIALPGREEARMLLVTEFRDYVVACTHLSLTEADRMASLPIIIAEASRWDKPFFLMGDLNAKPDSPFYQEMSRHFCILNKTSDPTFPSTGPNICIDYVAVFGRCGEHTGETTSRVGTEPYSDHCPLHVTTRLK